MIERDTEWLRAWIAKPKTQAEINRVWSTIQRENRELGLPFYTELLDAKTGTVLCRLAEMEG